MCHNHKPQPFPDTERKRKQTKPNKRKSTKRTKSTKIGSLFPKRGNHNAKRTEKKYKNKITQGNTLKIRLVEKKTQRNHKETNSATNTGNRLRTVSRTNHRGLKYFTAGQLHQGSKHCWHIVLTLTKHYSLQSTLSARIRYMVYVVFLLRSRQANRCFEYAQMPKIRFIPRLHLPSIYLFYSAQ